MVLEVLGSSSKGNCYLLKSDNDILIVECGISFSTIKRSVTDLNKVKGVLVTHEHKDHCKYFDSIVKSGFDVYASKGTNSVLKERVTENHHRRLKDMEAMKVYEIGEFKVMGFNVYHDVKEPFGFLIYHHECGTIMFATDTYLIGNKFSGVNHYLIEANYDRKTLFEEVNKGRTPKFQMRRVMESHFGLETCIYYLQSTDLSQVRNVVLLHLSDRHSDAVHMREEVEKAISVPCYVADKNFSIILQ